MVTSKPEAKARNSGPIAARARAVLLSPGTLVVAAFAIRMLGLIAQEKSEPLIRMGYHPIAYELGNIANSIARGHGFSSPLEVDTGPTAWVTPVYVYLLAGIFKLAGIYSPASKLIIATLNCVFSAFVCIPLVLTGKRLFGEWTAGASGWVWVLLPSATYFSTQGVWDTSLCALMLSLLFWALIEVRESQRLRDWVGFGALGALALLTNAAYLSFLPLWYLWLAWERKRPGVQRLVAVAAVTVVIGLSPWMIRNYVVFHKFIPLRSNFGLEFYLGNNPQVGDSWSWWLHPYDNVEERNRFQQMGELTYMRAKQSQVLHFVRTHPARFAQLIWNRFVQTWTGASEPIADLWPGASWRIRFGFVRNCLLSLLSFVGLLFARRSRNPAVFPLFSLVLAFPVVYYVTHTSFRYRHPLDPLLILLAVYGVAEIYARLRQAVTWTGGRAQAIGN
jgi:4-amino-4-deoxy-L-arabinose transferase-like glycosyltransferase